MPDQLRLMCVLAHPDDETLGTGGLIAKYVAEGVEVYLVTATRGERGWMGDEQDNPGPEALGRIRETELLAAAQVLGVHEVTLLDYIDGELDQAPPAEAIARIVEQLRRVRPQAVVTFDPAGAYGHPDHIAICQFTTAALVCAADPTYVDPAAQPAHRVLKLYYMADTQRLTNTYEPLIGEVVMPVDGVDRHAAPWPDWAVTTRLDAEAYWQTVSQAAACHRTQLSEVLAALDSQPEEIQKRLWGRPTLYRAYSMVNGGRTIETDLFAGLR